MSIVQPEKAKAEMQQAFEQMWEELHDWRAEHPAASFDEIAGQVTPRRRALMGHLLGHLARQHGDGEVVAGVRCPELSGVRPSDELQRDPPAGGGTLGGGDGVSPGLLLLRSL